MFSVQSAVCSVHCAVRSVKFEVCSVQSAVSSAVRVSSVATSHSAADYRTWATMARPSNLGSLLSAYYLTSILGCLAGLEIFKIFTRYISMKRVKLSII